MSTQFVVFLTSNSRKEPFEQLVNSCWEHLYMSARPVKNAIIWYFLLLRYHMFLFCEDDVGDQLCERVLGVLYEIWLIACVKSFPNPTLWKTFREMCMNWRHRTGITLTVFLQDLWRFDPYHWIMDPDLDPDPALFFSGFQNANKQKFFFSSFFAYFRTCTYCCYIYICLHW